jgi:deoxyribonuclease-4
MPLFGAHLSIAGGCHNALLSAVEHGMETVQLFTASPQMWHVRPAAASAEATGTQWISREFTAEEVRVFRRTLRQTRVRYPTAHDSYLINLASPEEGLYRRSVEAFVAEMRRAEQLRIRYLVMHPGAHLDSGEETGLARIATALDEVHARCPNYRLRVLLETTAGQGSNLGYRFEHLARILSLVAEPKRLGICLDTCHVFAAGYALAPESEYRATIRALAKLIGLRWLRLFHVNDSLKPLGQPGRSPCPHRQRRTGTGAVPPAGQRPALPQPAHDPGDAAGARQGRPGHAARAGPRVTRPGSRVARTTPRRER